MQWQYLFLKKTDEFQSKEYLYFARLGNSIEKIKSTANLGTWSACCTSSWVCLWGLWWSYTSCSSSRCTNRAERQGIFIQIN